MIHLLPDPWLGLHPVVPMYPEPLEVNYDLSISLRASVFIGCIHSATRYLLNRPSPGCLIHTTALTFPAIFAIRLAISQYQARKVYYPFFRSQGIPIPCRSLFTRSKRITTDDFFLLGGAAGALVSLWPRSLPGATGWPRLLGASIIGAFSAGLLFAKFSPRYETALKADAQAREDAVFISEKLALNYTLARAQTYLQLRRYTQGLWTYPTDNLVFPRPNNTHYDFAPATLEQGLASVAQDAADARALEKHKRDVASWLWGYLAEYEAVFYAERDEERRKVLRKVLDTLSTLHANLVHTALFAQLTQRRNEKLKGQLRVRFAGEGEGETESGKEAVPVSMSTVFEKDAALEQYGLHEMKQVLAHVSALMTPQIDRVNEMMQHRDEVPLEHRDEYDVGLEEAQLESNALRELDEDLMTRIQAVLDRLAVDMEGRKE